MAANVYNNLLALNCNVKFYKGPPSFKTRLLDIHSHQHLIRIDDDVVPENHLQFNEISKKDIEWADAIVISDYNKGYITYELVQELRANYDKNIFIDTKKHDLEKFNGCYVKVNEMEYNARTSINDKLIITLGAQGALLKQYDEEILYDIPTVEVVDVCGCGDTFLSALTYQYTLTNNIDESIKFANKAAGITVTHRGNYAPKLEEIN